MMNGHYTSVRLMVRLTVDTVLNSPKYSFPSFALHYHRIVGYSFYITGTSVDSLWQNNYPRYEIVPFFLQQQMAALENIDKIGLQRWNDVVNEKIRKNIHCLAFFVQCWHSLQLWC